MHILCDSYFAKNLKSSQRVNKTKTMWLYQPMAILMVNLEVKF